MEVAMAASSGGIAYFRSNENLVCNKNSRVDLGLFCSPSNRQTSMYSMFSDRSHLQYYRGAIKTYCGKKNKQKLKDLSALSDGSLSDKRKLKLLDILSKDLSALSNTFTQSAASTVEQEDDASLTEQVRGRILSEALQVLMKQLAQVKAERKERKRQLKAQKKALKAQKQKKKDDSSSSESSNCECEVVDMSQLRMIQQEKRVVTQISDNQNSQIHDTLHLDSQSKICCTVEESPKLIPTILVESPLNIAVSEGLNLEFAEISDRLGLSGGLNLELAEISDRLGLSGVPAVAVLPSSEIQVCMGGKCKKSGSNQLLAAFEATVNNSGIGCEVQVVGCKCMGKCRNAPNVRVQKEEDGNQLHMGVGIGDVDLIVGHHFGFKSPVEPQGEKITDLIPA